MATIQSDLRTRGRIAGITPFIKVDFNSFSLQNDVYLSNNVRYRHLADKVIDTKLDPRRGGFDVLDSYYSQKIIEITGTIVANSDEELRLALNDFKKNLRGQEGNLDIDYGNKVLRYKATVRSIAVPEEHFHTTRLPFTIEFLAIPWGKDLSQINWKKSGITSSPYNGSFWIEGSFSPFVTIVVTVNSETNMTVLKFENLTTGDSIEVSRSYASTEVLTIDVENETVKVGTTDVDFTGVFPEFDPGFNSIRLTVTDSGAFNVNLEIKYYPTYL